MNDFKNKFKAERDRLNLEIRQRVVAYIVGAFGLVAGLAWNEAVQELIRQLFPLDKNSLAVKFIYAVVITLVVVIVSLYLVRWIEKKPEDK